LAAGLGFHDSADRSRRVHLVLDVYGYVCDRHAFGAAIMQRAGRQVTVMREMAEAGDRAAIALLPVAGYTEQSARTSRRCRTTSGSLTRAHGAASALPGPARVKHRLAQAIHMSSRPNWFNRRLPENDGVISA